MAKKDKSQKVEVNANNLRSAGFADFEANHTFTKDTKLSEFTRAAIQAGLTNSEIVEIGNDIYGMNDDGTSKIKVNCLNWYRSSDPVLNPGKERYKATGAKAIEIRTTVNKYYEGLDEAAKTEFVNKMIETVTVKGLIELIKTDVLKSIVPAEIFPVKAKAEKRELTAAEKLMKKQEAAEKRAAKLRAELEALQMAEASTVTDASAVAEAI